MFEKKIKFYLIEKKHYETVFSWLHKKHVNEWFHGQGLQNTLRDLKKHVSSDQSRNQHWIASLDDVPFGYLITSNIDFHKSDSKNRFAKWRKETGEAVTLDLLIGEESFLGKGLSKRMIQEFLLDKFFHVAEVFIDPEATNAKAIHVYEKAGFQKLEQFIAEWHPVPHWLMSMKMEQLKQ